MKQETFEAIQNTAGAIATLSLLRCQCQEEAWASSAARRQAADEDERDGSRQAKRRAEVGQGILESAMLSLTWELLTLGDDGRETLLNALKSDTRKILHCE